MNMGFMKLVVPLATLAFFAQPAPAQETKPMPQQAASPTIAGWDELVNTLRDLPGQMLGKLPESMRDDPQIQQEVGRLILESLTSGGLDAIGGEGDYPRFLPSIGQVLNIGQPNADTIYRVAKITPGGTYRIRGKRGTLRMAVIAQVAPFPWEPVVKTIPPQTGRPHHDINALKVDAQGRFDVILSPTRPKGYQGDWWKLEPFTGKLLMRQVSGDWAKEQDLTISIERVDIPPQGRPRTSAAELEQRLRGLPKATRLMATMFVDHVEKNLRSQGFVNKLKIYDVVSIGGLAGQFYYEGAYDLHDDTALIVETKVPSKCLYRSIVLTNEIYETTDWIDSHSALNGSQADADKDGVLRVVVSNKDPGVPNWLDTAGYSRGVIQGRWFDCSETPVPSVRKVAFKDIRKSLPPETGTVTPAQRDKILRERRAQFQQRPLW